MGQWGSCPHPTHRALGPGASQLSILQIIQTERAYEWVCLRGCVGVCVSLCAPLPTHVSSTKPPNYLHRPHGEALRERECKGCTAGSGEQTWRRKEMGEAELKNYFRSKGWGVKMVNGTITVYRWLNERLTGAMPVWMVNKKNGLIKDTPAFLVVKQSAAFLKHRSKRWQSGCPA